MPESSRLGHALAAEGAGGKCRARPAASRGLRHLCGRAGPRGRCLACGSSQAGPHRARGWPSFYPRANAAAQPAPLPVRDAGPESSRRGSARHDARCPPPSAPHRGRQSTATAHTARDAPTRVGGALLRGARGVRSRVPHSGPSGHCDRHAALRSPLVHRMRSLRFSLPGGGAQLENRSPGHGPGVAPASSGEVLQLPASFRG